MGTPFVLVPKERRRYGHVIEDISFRAPRFVLCTCGYLVQNVTTDDALDKVFKAHRLSVGARRHI